MRVLDLTVSDKKTRECVRTDGLVCHPVRLASRLRLFRTQDVLRHFLLERRASGQKEVLSTVAAAPKQPPFRGIT